MFLFNNNIRVSIAAALAVVLVVLIANARGTVKTYTRGVVIENAKTFVKNNVVMSLVIVAFFTFVFNEMLKSVNNMFAYY